MHSSATVLAFALTLPQGAKTALTPTLAPTCVPTLSTCTYAPTYFPPVHFWPAYVTPHYDNDEIPHDEIPPSTYTSEPGTAYSIGTWCILEVYHGRPIYELKIVNNPFPDDDFQPTFGSCLKIPITETVSVSEGGILDFHLCTGRWTETITPPSVTFTYEDVAIVCTGLSYTLNEIPVTTVSNTQPRSCSPTRPPSWAALRRVVTRSTLPSRSTLSLA